MSFDRIAVLDWSAAARPRTGRDSIWLGLAASGGVSAENLSTRAAAAARLDALVAEALEARARLLIGADFAFGYPAGFAAVLTGRPEALAVWEWLAARVEDGPDNANNRFAVAAEANRAFPGLGPFWFRPAAQDLPDLPDRGRARSFRDLPELRQADRLARGAQSVWKLGGAGSVGGQVLTGLPVLWRLRQAHPGRVAVWPLEDWQRAPVVLAEVFPSLLAGAVAEAERRAPGLPRDAHQVCLLARALARLAAAGRLAALFHPGQPPALLREEGWILGVGHETALQAAAGDWPARDKASGQEGALARPAAQGASGDGGGQDQPDGQGRAGWGMAMDGAARRTADGGGTGGAVAPGGGETGGAFAADREEAGRAVAPGAGERGRAGAAGGAETGAEVAADGAQRPERAPWASGEGAAAADGGTDGKLAGKAAGKVAAGREVSAGLTPPRLRDDCFAMPQGVAWVPVHEALARLREALEPVTGQQTLPVASAAGRILAAACLARRPNPPAANAAVDGYGFAHAATGDGVQRLPLLPGRAAAGQPYPGAVPPGSALRILTGAILPPGVDTVVLDEDTATDGEIVAFDGPVKPRANTRRAGEDVAAGAEVLAAGHRLRPPDLALLTALGLDRVRVHRPLRVAVLSTGDELVADAATQAVPHQIFDANRPMLLSVITGWGHVPVDLGLAPDDAGAIAERLDRGAAEADAIVASGGASAGDEDHVARLLRTQGRLSSWRIALKPGRPLALAMWRGVPVFGLPGNPVAALVCALIFARPALSVLAGGGWIEPQAFTVEAGFSKRKKPGRREFLRARIGADGRAEVFASEGSGRISGLVWATGLVELPDGAADIRPGAPVRFLPYAGFGI